MSNKANSPVTSLAFLQTDAHNVKRYIPPVWYQILTVWHRHLRHYMRYWFSNILPPFLEPLIFLVGIGLGLGRYVESMDGMPYLRYLSVGLLVTASMFTASFECTYSTFYRLKYDKVYAVMLATPLTPRNLLLGEILWASSKGFLFSASVLIIMLLSGIIQVNWGVLAAPLVGFLTAAMFATLGHLITSYVKAMSHFSFLFSGLLSPMFFFSGAVFPLNSLPENVRIIAEFLPLSHSVRLMRGLADSSLGLTHLWDLGYILLFITVFALLSGRRLIRQLID